MEPQTNCIFCKIVAGKAPAVKILEEQDTLAFMDINPATNGHTLVVSKEHAEGIEEISAESLTAVTLATQHIARAIYRALEPDGMRVSQFNGAPAGQTVFHYHVHLVPIWQGQRVGSHGQGAGDMEQIKATADRIRTALRELSI